MAKEKEVGMPTLIQNMPNVEKGPKRFEVKLQNAPTRIVEAKDQANAWEEYKRVMGLVRSEYVAEITEVA